MSRENVEIVRKATDALNRRDWDELSELCDPDIEVPGTIGGLEEDRLIRGLDGIRQIFEMEDTEVWEQHVMVPRMFIDAGERVVVLQREYQRGKGSGIEVVADTAVVSDVRDGRVVRIQPYMDQAAALEAVGLSDKDVIADS